MSCSFEYAPQLRARGYRITPQRMVILHILRHSAMHLTPREIYKQAIKDYPKLTEPTVYRTLEFLAKNGLAHPARGGGGRLTYEFASDDHHHIICRNCGSGIQVDHRLLERLYRMMESKSRYALIDSHVTFFGVCPQCQKK